MKVALILFVAFAGILNTIQSGSNATLNKTLDRPMWAIVSVFATALATAIVFALVSGERLPSRDDIALVPWWAWIGGVFGAIYIVSMITAVDALGAAIFTGLTVTIAVVTSLVMDHYGLMGFEVRQAGLGRIAGALMMIGGLVLIARF